MDHLASFVPRKVRYTLLDPSGRCTPGGRPEPMPMFCTLPGKEGAPQPCCLRYALVAMSRVGAGCRPGIATQTIPKTKDDGLYDRDGWLFRQEMVDCGKGATGRCRKCTDGPGHGPYWYRYRWYNGKMHKRYVGKRLPPQDQGPF